MQLWACSQIKFTSIFSFKIKCSLDKKQYCCVLTLMFTSPIVKQNQKLDQKMIV